MSRWPYFVIAFSWAAASLCSRQLAAALPTSLAENRGFSDRLIIAQNAERRSLGLRPLRWDRQLEDAASAYATTLAVTGNWQHSAIASRRGQGENLWMGTHGAFTVEQMTDGWIAEKRMFRPGIFPNVSSTGRWEDVGHYTQVIWADTDRIGCGLRSSRDYDYLVCRYAQAGNVMGQNVMPARSSTTSVPRTHGRSSIPARIA